MTSTLFKTKNINIFAQLLTLHKAGFTYNDVRLLNMIYGVDGYTRLIDFEYVISKSCLSSGYNSSENTKYVLSRLEKLTTFQSYYPKLNSDLNASFLANPNFFFAWLCLNDMVAFCNCFKLNFDNDALLYKYKITDEVSTFEAYNALIDMILNEINPNTEKSV